MTQYTQSFEASNGDHWTINTTINVACLCAGGCGRPFGHIQHGSNPCWCLDCWLAEYRRERATVE